MDELIRDYNLSQYHTLHTLDSNENAILVENSENGLLYVKKSHSYFDLHVFENIMKHPHSSIAKIQDLFLFDSELITIEEFINGSTLFDILEKNGALDEAISYKIFLELCDALIHLHSLNEPVIHRDIKLTNIMVDNNYNVKLIDFNIARHFKSDTPQDTMIMGTAGFAAPEQFGFRQTDARTDVYSLGVLLNYLLTGEHPKDHLYSGALRNVILKCIQLDPTQRYQSVAYLKSEMTKVIRATRPIPIPKQKDDSGLDTKRSIGYYFSILYKATVILSGLIVLLMVYSDSPSALFPWSILERIFQLVFITYSVVLYANLGNIHRYLPLCSHRNLLVRGLGCYLYFIAFILLWAVISTFAKYLYSSL